MDIDFKLNQVEQRMQIALLNSPDPKQKIKLVAVTKNRSISEIEQVLAKGYRILGENRVQELMEKYSQVKTNVDWHLIGHLQRNKVKFITDKVQLIHSLDSYNLALEINKRMSELKKSMDCLVQVNVASEESKFGLKLNEVKPFLEEVSLLPYVKIKGLMTIAPEVENAEEVRPVFRSLANLFAKIKQDNLPSIDLRFLSMGMTNDFTVAIEEGANMVRIGSAIFGPR